MNWGGVKIVNRRYILVLSSLFTSFINKKVGDRSIYRRRNEIYFLTTASPVYI
jgi:hypothetical protein